MRWINISVLEMIFFADKVATCTLYLCMLCSLFTVLRVPMSGLQSTAKRLFWNVYQRKANLQILIERYVKILGQAPSFWPSTTQTTDSFFFFIYNLRVPDDWVFFPMSGAVTIEPCIAFFYRFATSFIKYKIDTLETDYLWEAKPKKEYLFWS